MQRPSRLIRPLLTTGRPAVLAALVAALVTGLFTAAALPVLAQGSAGEGIDGFLRTGDYIVVLDGQERPKAEVYFASRASALLIMGSDFKSPVMITQRSGKVESVNLMKVAVKDGKAKLLPGAVLADLGGYKLEQAGEGTDVLFTVDGKQARLRPRPPLTGRHDRADLIQHSPQYLLTADGYEPDSGTVARLNRVNEDVKVRVYFGSWCSVCKRFLPNALKLQESLDDSKVAIEYYGLPKPPEAWKDPEVSRLGIKGVPTGIVYVNGKEAGRIQGGDWAQVERRIAQLVKEAG